MHLLFFPLAIAAEPHAGISFGGALSQGMDQDLGYVSLAPMGAASYTYHLGPLEGWGGVSASGLLGVRHQQEMMVAPLQFDVGLGFGTPLTAVGLYAGEGFGGEVWGLYGRYLVEGQDNERAYGIEARFFGIMPGGDAAFSLMGRMEFGRFSTRPIFTPPPPPEAPPETPEAPAPVHHDDPYG
jgi:hypothetical protein